MKEVIKQIIDGENLEDIYNCVINDFYTNGPINKTYLEILCYLNIYQKAFFSSKENQILKYMGLTYKETDENSLEEIVIALYSNYIKTEYGYTYTPVQANIIKNIGDNNCFSFSAPTSTGKSFVFRNLILNTKNDVVIVVPSRALINEYYHELTKAIEDKRINILMFIDKINTKHSNRNVFIVTPERCKELYKFGNDFTIDYFLFDEAQLSDEESSRGMYFDSIVRRSLKNYPEAKFVFAHPFVANPEAQISKNHFNNSTSLAKCYQHKNVGQMFYAFDDDSFFHFGLEPDIMGKKRIKCTFDPISETLSKNGSVLVYCTKASIYSGKVFRKYTRYLRNLKKLTNPLALKIINHIKNYIGGEDTKGKERYSLLLNLLKRGVVIHHGSLPLQTRQLLEEFTQKGFCRVCFATSTLEQGVNMPFDVVVLNTFKASKPLSLKNIIGRAGRSTEGRNFDYGCIVIKTANIGEFRKIMNKQEILEDVSMLEKDVDNDLRDFKDAIINGTFSDEYNISDKQLSRLSSNSVFSCISEIVEILYDNYELQISKVSGNTEKRNRLIELFTKIYEEYLHRELSIGEKCVLDTSIKILLWQMQSKKFKDICFYRYSYATKLEMRKELARQRNMDLSSLTEQLHIKPEFMMPYSDIPNKRLNAFSLFGVDSTVDDVNYDLIVYDTYDYLDKMIGFKLSDIYYASIDLYYKATSDIRAQKLCYLVKYGTDNDKVIWMERYGFSFEEIDWLEPCVDMVNQEEIVFNNNVNDLSEDQLNRISRFMW